MRIAILGNAGGGKSTLARRLAGELRLPLHEVDRLLWRPGWILAPTEDYEAEHSRIVSGDRWIIDGLGRRDSVAPRVARATTVILVDLPLWVHFWLAAERQIAWVKNDLDDRPGGLPEMPPTEALFEMIWTVDRDWMPAIRDLVGEAEVRGTDVHRLHTLDDVAEFSL